METAQDNTKTVNKIGRPLKYTPEQMSTSLDMYCAERDADSKPITITGFCSYIGTNRETLSEYYERDGFADVIKRLRGKCEAYAADFLFSGKNPAGAIFTLKNLHGWVDKTETTVSGNVMVTPNPAQLEAFMDRLLTARQSRLADENAITVVSEPVSE
jgi:hypothetical protein